MNILDKLRGGDLRLIGMANDCNELNSAFGLFFKRKEKFPFSF
ncbi:MAG: hypothetical protein ABFR31_01450 [Thermodesulfobacteriota bacterium]